MLAASNEDGAASSESLKTGDDVDGRTYSDAAAAQRQPSLTSLLPQRSLTLVALFVLGGIAITGIELLYTKFFIGLPDQFRDSLAVLDVASRGSVALVCLANAVYWRNRLAVGLLNSPSPPR